MPFDATEFRVSTVDGRTYVLLAAVTYISEAGEKIVIPAGSTSDGASTPRGMWNLLPPFGDYWRACFLHDYLYRNTTKPKQECDSLLLEAMESCGVFKLERDAIYQGVVDLGQFSFDQDRKASRVQP
jgi:hypothetical protein